MDTLPDALAPLAAYRQWVNWIATPSKTKPGKFDKLPVDPTTGHVSSAHDAAAWTDAHTAIARGRALGAGVAFVFSDADPYFLLDVDNCLLPDGSGWNQTAIDLCARFPGAAVEVSQSGAGLHIIGATTRTPAHGTDNKALGAQLYTSRRFVALTGSGIIGTAATDCTGALERLIADCYPVAQGLDSGGAEWTDEPAPEWNGYTDDDQLLSRALATSSGGAVFGGKASFRDLWEANEEVLGRVYPDDHQGRAFDASAADAALAQHLAFWTGNDCERIRRLMMRSALYREKWEGREDYLPRTVTRAVGLQKTVYTAGGVEPPPQSVQPGSVMSAARAELVAGLQYLAPQQQIEHFAGCVYVRDAHKVLTPDGALLDQGQFRAVYGGYLFALDATADKTSKNAWEAFVESQAVRHPKVAATQFRPDLPPGEIIERDGEKLVNNYVEARVRMEPGDPSPFLRHLSALLPDDRDRAILLAYMAACVQHKGAKFQWAPLIQGVEGNGKTLFSRCVAEAIGMKYVHVPRAEEISTKFNSWMKDRIFVYVEDVYMQDGRAEVFEALKPIITNDWQAVEPKGRDQKTEYVVANLMLNSNHRDALRKTRNDRRIAPFFTAQQQKDDKARDGLTREYFRELYDWLKGRGRYASGGAGYGYAVVAHFLASYEIPDELNPATGQDAPDTSSTEAAIEASRGGVEQEILEAIEEGRPGFAGGWVSSMALDRLLESLRATRQIPHNKRRELMTSLGYDLHPGLSGGRVNNPVQPDGGKTRLYIRAGHIHANLQTPAEIARHYTDAQNVEQVAAGVQVFGGGAQ